MYSIRQRSSHAVCAIGSAFLLSLWSSAAAAADWKDRLATEAPTRWMAIEDYYSKMEVSFRKIYAMPTDGKPSHPSFIGTLYHDVRVNGNRIVCLIHQVGKDASEKTVDNTRVRCVNLSYAFDLAKSDPAAESFTLANYEPISDKVRQKAYNLCVAEYHVPFEGSQFGRLSEMLKNPSFTITNVRDVQRKGKTAVQFEYDYRYEVKVSDKQTQSQSKEVRIEHGAVVVDPEHSWCILQTHFDNQYWTGDETVEYGEDLDGFPIPRRLRHTSTNKKTGGYLLITFEFDKFIHRDIPESEFTLSAFGMPELQLPGEQKPNLLWRWLIGIGIALGVLAVLIRIYVKKRQVRQPA